jgi:hypothetical protein
LLHGFGVQDVSVEQLLDRRELEALVIIEELSVPVGCVRKAGVARGVH